MDKEKLKVWALAAEVISGIAVVVTLVFLVFGMRSNTSATQAQTYQLLMQELNAYRTLFAEPGMAAIVVKFEQQGWDALEPVEQRQLYATATIRWGFYESAYYANKRGVLGESEWQRFVRAYCRARRRGLPVPWNPKGLIPVTELLTPEFVEFVQATCK